MRKNIIDGFGNAGRVILARQGIFGGKTIINLGGSFFGSRAPGKLFKILSRLLTALAVADMIHIAFYKTPEQVRFEALQQENRAKE
ncbi:MAG: hypothetical protein LBI47_01255 [Puniceicoccales bacterium]|nr:hypothetical protein [Puniceicoccales bacterium]